MRNPKKPLLALDPGLCELGYALLEGERLVTSGVGAFRRMPASRRLPAAKQFVRDLLRLYTPRTIVLEQTAHHPTAGLARVHRFARSVERLAKRLGLEVATYSVQRVRKELLGNGWASKAEAAAAIARRYPALAIYLTQDRQWKERYWQNMFDAVALALHHQGHPPSRSRSCG